MSEDPGNPRVPSDIRQKPRDLSPFFFEEMLYDYVSGALDSKRDQAMKHYLEHHPEASPDVDCFKFSLKYCDDLSNVKISPEFFIQIMQEPGWFKKLLLHLDWRRWPSIARWGTEAFLVSGIITLIFVFIPWDMAKDLVPSIPTQAQEGFKSSGKRIFVEEKINGNLDGGQWEGPKLPLIATKTSPSPLVLAKRSEGSASNKPSPASLSEKPSQKLNAQRNATSSNDTIAASPTKIAKTNVAKTDSLSGDSKAISDSEPGVEITTSKAAKKDMVIEKGIIYRARMKIGNLEDKAEELLKKLLSFDAKKAGRVELGWKKPSGRYYHFTIPSGKYAKFIKYLKTQGTLNISRDQHWRVMPEGVDRFIMFIEDDLTALKKINKPSIPVEGSTEKPVENPLPSVKAETAETAE